MNSVRDISYWTFWCVESPGILRAVPYCKAKLIKKRSTRSRPVKKVFFLLNVAIRGFDHFLYNTTQLNSFSDTGAATRGQRVTDLPQTELK